jgi:hypothetical protein
MRTLFFALLVGCAGPSANVRKTDAVLLVECEVPSAAVYVDESFAGRAAEMGKSGLKVVHGTLRVEVRADGYFPAYKDVEVKEGERARVQIQLRAVPEGEAG